MPSAESLKRLTEAEVTIKAAQEEFLSFLERRDRDFSEGGRQTRNRLLGAVQDAIDDYWEAFDAAAESNSDSTRQARHQGQ